MYVLDTCVFNWLLDGRLDYEDLPRDASLVATHVQLDELTATRSDERRAHLLERFESTHTLNVPTKARSLVSRGLAPAK